MRRALSPAVALAWLALGPGPAVAAEPPALTVFAAADLTFAFRELAPRFEKATGVRVTLVFGSTANFAHQIREGGPADVFFAADRSFVDALAAAVVRRSPRPELGLAFIQFVNGPEGRPVMKRYGFMLPGEF